MERARFAAAVALLGLIAACDLGPSGPTSDDVSVVSRSANGQCPTDVRSGAAPGASCTVSGDCAELCCTCATGTKSFAAQVCVNHVCQSKAAGCPKAEENAPDRCQ